MSTHRPSLGIVLSETSRIISAQPRHFLGLSVLFLFPITFATIVYPFLLQPTSVYPHYHSFLSYVSTPDSKKPLVGKSQLLIQVLYGLFVLLFELCAIPSITHSTSRVFYSGPVRFISSLKSILVSFFPLLATVLVTKITLVLILFAACFFFVLPLTGLLLLGFDMNRGSMHYWVVVILIAVLLKGLLTYLQVEWYLTTVVVVAESQWGFSPLKRSSYLVKGMRWTVFLMILFFGILSSFLSICYWSFMASEGRINDGWIGWWAVLVMVVYAGFSTILSLYSFVAKTVLFVYCKALYEEFAFQIDEKLGGNYVPLPLDVVNAV